MSKTENRDILKKMYVIAAIFVIVLITVFVKIFRIQYVYGDELRAQASQKTTEVFTIEANRGNIYDNQGSLLATSVSRYDIYFDPITVSEENFSSGLVGLCDELSKMSSNSSSYYQNLFRKSRAEGKRYVRVLRNVSYDDYLKLKQFPIFKLGQYRGGLVVEEFREREYPMGKIGERTIGYQRLDKKGTYEVGLEGAFDEVLTGREGKRLKQKISKNQWKPIYDENEIEPLDGYDLYSTLDMNIQDIAHHALLQQLEHYEADHGSVIVMEVETGAIKAISNLGRNSRGQYYERLNYAINEAHEPGSTIKPIILMAALADKKVDTSMVVNTRRGSDVFYGRTIYDSGHEHGEMSLARAFEKSSNIAMARVIDDAYKDNPKQFIDRLKSWGLHEPIGIDIQGEGKPNLPEPGKDNWSRNALPSMAYGYNLTLTPLQQLSFYNTIANNGKMMRPYFVKEVRSRNNVIKSFEPEVLNNQIASKEVIAQMQDLLANVVKRGTGRTFYSPYYSIAGKTGTAQTEYWMKDWRANPRYVSSFAGYFPVENPKYSCIVVIHKPKAAIGYYGALVTGDVFKRIAQKITTSEPILVEAITQDSVVNKTLAHYKEYDAKLNFEAKDMPDVRGMHAMDAISLLENIGLKIKIEGSGIVREQSILKGNKIKKGQVVKLRLS